MENSAGYSEILNEHGTLIAFFAIALLLLIFALISSSKNKRKESLESENPTPCEKEKLKEAVANLNSYYPITKGSPHQELMRYYMLLTLVKRLKKV